MEDENTPSDPVVAEAYIRAVESQIEAAKFAVSSWGFSSKKFTPIEQIVLFALLEEQPWHGFEFKAQHRIGRYTVDFLVSEEMNWKDQFVIECDGHEFHERTKEQAAHDKKRDRELQALGFKVYRFTGSEIWKTRGKCVTEALGIH